VVRGFVNSRTFAGVMTNHTLVAAFGLLPAPPLTILPTENGVLDVLWPDSYSVSLFASPIVGPGASWNPVLTPPVQAGGYYRVTVTPEAGTMFYGLGP
jgi:hypothetical protein